jgi:hypothetical protein
MSRDFEDKETYIKKVSLAARAGKEAARRTKFEVDEVKRNKKRNEELERQEKEREAKLARAKKSLDRAAWHKKEGAFDDDGLDLDEGLHGNFASKYGPGEASALKEARDKYLERKKKRDQQKEEDAKKPILERVKNRIFGK